MAEQKMKKIKLKYAVNDKVWWLENDQVLFGRVESAEVVVDNTGAKINYSVIVDEKFCGYSYIEMFTEDKLFSSKAKLLASVYEPEM